MSVRTIYRALRRTGLATRRALATVRRPADGVRAWRSTFSTGNLKGVGTVSRDTTRDVVASAYALAQLSTEFAPPASRFGWTAGAEERLQSALLRE